MITEPPKVEDHITVHNARSKEDVEFFMSYGLLNDMVKVVNANPETVAILDITPELSEIVLLTLFAERSPEGKIIKEVPFDLSIEDAERVFDWVKEHLLSFFMRRLSKTKTLFDSRKDQMANLGSSQTG